MSSAGYSAGQEGRRQTALAGEYGRHEAEARLLAERWMIAHSTERQVAATLAPLSAAGYTFLHDRGWPGARGRAQIDHVLVGPGGLFIVDTKSWAEVQIAGGRLWRGQHDATDDLLGLADVAYGTEAVMALLGLPPGEVHVVVVLANQVMPPTAIGSVVVVGERQAASHINSRGRRLTAAQADVVLAAALRHFPVLGVVPARLDATIVEPARAETPPEPLVSVEDVAEVLLAGLLAQPVEEWMAFLHPSQAKLVRRSFNGPSRIRGAAGTGKTVVGLHRAAYLARSTDKPILVTSFVKTLPAVLSNLLVRLAPEVRDRVHFVGVHAFASRLLHERGIRTNLKIAEADAMFDKVWREHGVRGPLGAIDRSKHYWRDEVSKVIKGRGLTDFDRYADLTRTGRKRPLTLDQRRSVWLLYVAYETELRERGIQDFDDLILQAEATLLAYPLDTYGGVVIDEAQDLTCAMVRMLHLLVGNAPDGLTLIGDGQQSIYPGGFTLAEAGVSLAGRGVVMTTNYRNTRQIVEFASELVTGDRFADIEGDLEGADATTAVLRSGPAPTLAAFSSHREHDAALLSWFEAVECPPGDIAVLCLTTREVTATLTALANAGIAASDLKDYAGLAVSAVKVGTVKRAKGLEFKQVVLPRVRPEWLDPSGGDDDVHQIRRRELYVAMTRARDGLWVGVCA